MSPLCTEASVISRRETFDRILPAQEITSGKGGIFYPLQGKLGGWVKIVKL